MAQPTSIEWTDVSCNPVRGCSRVSSGCTSCYAEVMAARFSDSGYWGHGFAERTKAGGRWTGKVELIQSKLAEPLSWKAPRRCFVNSTSDLFHEKLPFEDIAAVYGVMAACPHITFQVLTKRPEQRREFFSWLMSFSAAPDGAPGPDWSSDGFCRPISVVAAALSRQPVDCSRAIEFRGDHPWPLPNVWGGTSVEDQPTADKRIPELLQTPATVRFLSCEPLLGPLDLSRYQPFAMHAHPLGSADSVCGILGGAVSWLIAGGESGHNARPMHPEWARTLRDQCVAAGVAFLFKQFGEYAYLENHLGAPPTTPNGYWPVGKAATHPWGEDRPDAVAVARIGKHAAGRLLDGREWSEFPVGRTA